MYCVIIFFIYITSSFLIADDYILEFQAKVHNLKEFNISKGEQFRSYELVGTFTDNYGNYGKSNIVIVSDVKDGKLLRLDATGENIYSNNEKLYMRSVREKSDIDAGIAYNIIIGASKKFKSLIGIQCTTSVRYFEDAIFGIQKCNLSKDMTVILKNSNN